MLKYIGKSMDTVKGSLEDFDMLWLAYRAEIEYNGILYKFWKEHGVCRRLEKFRIGGDIIPYEYHRFIFVGDEKKELPKSLWRSDQWTLYMLGVPYP